MVADLGPPEVSEDPGPDNDGSFMYRAYASNGLVIFLLVYIVVWAVVLLTLGVTLLPSVVAPAMVEAGNSAAQIGATSGPGADAATPARILADQGQWELNLLLLVLCGGAFGGLVHLATSLAWHIGHRQLMRSWTFYYIVRPLNGAGVALLVYFVLRMGVLSPAAAAAGNVSVYGVLTFSSLSGLFARQALDKLAEVFDVLFQKTKKVVEDKDASDLLETENPYARLPRSRVPTTAVFSEERVRAETADDDGD